MKTPEEIKKGLACCAADVNGSADCWHCPYSNDPFTVCVGEQMAADALTYINDLEAAHRTEYYENADYDCITLRKTRKRVETLEAKVAELETENELTLKRLSHLLESDFIRSFDQHNRKTHTYKRDIAEADKIACAPKWISVTTQMPRDGQRVLTVDDNGKSEVLYYDKRWPYIFCDCGGLYKVCNITHWMPLPEAPKEGKTC